MIVVLISTLAAVVSAAAAAVLAAVPCLLDGTVGRLCGIAFINGTVIGAVLDRNRLRPSQCWVTVDDLGRMAMSRPFRWIGELEHRKHR